MITVQMADAKWQAPTYTKSSSLLPASKCLVTLRKYSLTWPRLKCLKYANYNPLNHYSPSIIRGQIGHIWLAELHKNNVIHLIVSPQGNSKAQNDMSVFTAISKLDSSPGLLDALGYVWSQTLAQLIFHHPKYYSTTPYDHSQKLQKTITKLWNVHYCTIWKGRMTYLLHATTTSPHHGASFLFAHISIYNFTLVCTI